MKEEFEIVAYNPAWKAMYLNEKDLQHWTFGNIVKIVFCKVSK